MMALDGTVRIVHCLPAISEEASGPSYSVVRMCEALIARRHKVVLATLALSHSSQKPDFLKTFPIGAGPRRLGRSPAMMHWLRQQVQSGLVDVLHSNGMWQMNAVYPGWVARKGEAQLVVSPRGAFSTTAMGLGSVAKRVFWPLVQRPSLMSASCFHATAESEYLDIRRLGFRQPVAVIPNGVDVPQILPREPSESRTLLYLGRIHPIKGLDMLLPAWRSVQSRFPEWKLSIVGGDEGYYGNSGYLEDMKSLANRLGLQRVEFLGGLHGASKWTAYRDADLFVLPTYSENFGIAVAEALAAGTPAIVSRGAPWPDLDRRGAGWWIEVGEQPLVACLENALSTPPERLAAMGAAGRRWMIEGFSWARLAEMMATTYQWLGGHRPQPSWVRGD